LRKLNVLRIFLIQNGYEDTLLGRNGEILLHMGSVENQKDALTEFFGWLATNTDLPKARRQAEVMNINVLFQS
jgi:hypothetical protein